MRVILQADQRQKQNHKEENSAGSSSRTVPIGRRTWTDVEPGEYSISDFDSVEDTDSSSSLWKPTSRQ